MRLPPASDVAGAGRLQLGRLGPVYATLNSYQPRYGTGGHLYI
jgi:hypothetical protein